MATPKTKPCHPAAKTHAAAASRPRKPRKPVLLCVDDDPGIVAAIELRLRSYDVQVLGYYTGMQGYWQAVVRRPDLIITDLRMPQGDGDYLLECLRRNPLIADIPVLVLTGLRADDLRGRMEHLGAAAVLQKPIRGEELVKHIARFIPLRARQRADAT